MRLSPTPEEIFIKHESSKVITPGPGSYNIESSIGAISKFQMLGLMMKQKHDHGSETGRCSGDWSGLGSAKKGSHERKNTTIDCGKSEMMSVYMMLMKMKNKSSNLGGKVKTE